MPAEVREVQWSDLQRDPKTVAALTDDGDVRVKRRDGVDLLLTREDRLAESNEGSFTTARALRNLIAHAPAGVAAEAMTEEFPWLGVLPPADTTLFIADFIRATQIAAELGQWGVLARTIREWKATAAIHADPDLLRRLTTPVTEDHGPVPSPMA